MASFKAPFKHIMKFEGEYSNHCSDRGGETYKGIARVVHPTWGGWEKVDAWKSAGKPDGGLRNDKDLQADIRKFYKSRYWNSFKGDKIPSQAIAEELFDIAVNMGCRIAGKFLQRALNILNQDEHRYDDIAVDGRVGPATLGTMAKLSERDRENSLLKLISLMQGARYIEICEKNPSQEVFIRGWLTRVSFEKK